MREYYIDIFPHVNTQMTEILEEIKNEKSGHIETIYSHNGESVAVWYVESEMVETEVATTPDGEVVTSRYRRVWPKWTGIEEEEVVLEGPWYLDQS